MRKFTVRRIKVIVIVVAVALALVVPSDSRAIRTASSAVRKAYPGIDLRKYHFHVGGPSYPWNRCVSLRHEDGKSGMNVLVEHVPITIHVHSDGPPPLSKN